MKKTKIQFFIFYLLFVYSCSTSPNNCRKTYLNIDGNCYFEGDINILQSIIDSSLSTISLTLDNNNNNSIEPLELGIQKWSKDGRLTFLWIYDKSLNTNIPENIGDIAYLDTLNMALNNLYGKIPESIGNLDKLDFLYLYSNNLNGTIPDSICNIIPNLSHFWIEYNQLCPPYPDCIPQNEIISQDTTDCL